MYTIGWLLAVICAIVGGLHLSIGSFGWAGFMFFMALLNGYMTKFWVDQ